MEEPFFVTMRDEKHNRELTIAKSDEFEDLIHWISQQSETNQKAFGICTSSIFQQHRVGTVTLDDDKDYLCTYIPQTPEKRILECLEALRDLKKEVEKLLEETK